MHCYKSTAANAVEVSVRHENCMEDEMTFVALAAAIDLSMDACRIFSQRLRNELGALKVLGKGAMGTVFLVHDPSFDPFARCPFVLKVVDKSALRSKLDGERRARWKIQVLTRLSSPNPYSFLPSIMGSFESD
ncbi:serine/threonine-protein kinase OXI1-like [Pyrus ussuriensis x Pyrus communis]|uniref:Serine/threonine-protein kinase OXI1-like n=1 Tax=Pyrus ussuriensis x Pyrus communis TaxID=2448454 RepID=A0A5N5GWD8_9ROSA|nr:serine/threonine-protein kinase OXI1-like [Pyrus ussuriensis x Pyrus communis]